MSRAFALAFLIAFGAAPSVAATCDSLAAAALKDAKVTHAEVVAAGAFAPYGDLPEFCRIAATLTPSRDSDIKIEVWLPAHGWNGKFQAVGNGGWAGSIVYPSIGRALGNGYATASTDTGHAGGSGSFALGHPEKLTDFGYRAV